MIIILEEGAITQVELRYQLLIIRQDHQAIIPAESYIIEHSIWWSSISFILQFKQVRRELSNQVIEDYARS